MSQIPASIVSMRSRNPIRQIVDEMKTDHNPAKEMISFALGDPTVYGNLKVPNRAIEAVTECLVSCKANGYGPSTGIPTAKEAIVYKINEAQYSSVEGHSLSASDVIITSGCSGALDLCIGVLCNEGQNILIPRPGFSLYETLASSKGVECKYYNLLPSRKWEIDLVHLESQIDMNTSCIVLNNPSNPCGSVYSKEHLISFLEIAEKHRLPVIADEIYAEMVFSTEKHIPLASLLTKTPILSCSGLAKRFLAPGWRVGWICIFDKENRFELVRKGLSQLSQLIIGANTLIQAAIPKILTTDTRFHEETMEELEDNSKLMVETIRGIPGLKVIEPQGAMYVMVEIILDEFNDIRDDVQFVEKLVQEQSLLCLPGRCFKCQGAFVRLVTTSPALVLKEGLARLKEFCIAHKN